MVSCLSGTVVFAHVELFVEGSAGGHQSMVKDGSQEIEISARKPVEEKKIVMKNLACCRIQMVSETETSGRVNQASKRLI